MNNLARLAGILFLLTGAVSCFPGDSTHGEFYMKTDTHQLTFGRKGLWADTVVRPFLILNPSSAYYFDTVSLRIYVCNSAIEFLEVESETGRILKQIDLSEYLDLYKYLGMESKIQVGKFCSYIMVHSVRDILIFSEDMEFVANPFVELPKNPLYAELFRGHKIRYSFNEADCKIRFSFFKYALNPEGGFLFNTFDDTTQVDFLVP